MIDMPALVGDAVRSVGLSTAMRAAGVVTGLLPIPQPVLLVGSGASRRLGESLGGFGHRRVLLVTDRGVAGLGLHRPLLAGLRVRRVEHVLYDAVGADAPLADVERGVALYLARKCDAVVAVGGGSSMDAAKVIASAATNGKSPRQLVGYFRGLKTPAPIYAVPTTAGTGSEVTVAAVVSDPEAGRKLVIADSRLVPQMAALDPALMAGLPRAITAATGMDALTHAIEAYLSTWAGEHTDRLALAAVATIYADLRTVCRNGRDLAARERMSLAASYAGLAFTRANVGYVHAIAHQLGGRYHVPHGLANAILLPHVLRFLSPSVTRRLAQLALHAGIARRGERSATLAAKFIASVEALARDVGIPSTVAELCEDDIPALAKAACWEADTNYPVPRYMSPATCEEILRQVLPKADRGGAPAPRRQAQGARRSS